MFQDTLNPVLTKNEQNIREAWKITYLSHFLLTFLTAIAMMGWRFYLMNTGMMAPDEQFLHPLFTGVIILLVLALNFIFYKKTYQQYGFWWLAIGTAINLSQFVLPPIIHQTEAYSNEVANVLIYLHFNPQLVTILLGAMQILSVLYLVLSAFLFRINWKYQKGLDKIERTFVDRHPGEEPTVILVNKK